MIRTLATGTLVLAAGVALAPVASAGEAHCCPDRDALVNVSDVAVPVTAPVTAPVSAIVGDLL